MIVAEVARFSVLGKSWNPLGLAELDIALNGWVKRERTRLDSENHIHREVEYLMPPVKRSLRDRQAPSPHRLQEVQVEVEIDPEEYSRHITKAYEKIALAEAELDRLLARVP